MAQELKAKKVQFAVRAVELAERALAVVRDLRECVDNYADNEYAPGGAYELTQVDLDKSTVAHLTPQVLANLMTAFTAIYTLNAANRVALRKAVVKP